MGKNSGALVHANQTWEITSEGTINALKSKIMPGAKVSTLTPPNDKNGSQQIYVKYSGEGRPGEVPNGSKFWVKCTGLVAKAQRVA
ncbi:MAG: hypothetical protein ACPGOV_09005 [Magnetovibrionaceae bacterium]